MERRHVTIDVFTDRTFGGNPVAVVLDAAGLATTQMQAIAVEFTTRRQHSFYRRTTPTIRLGCASSRQAARYPLPGTPISGPPSPLGH